MRARRHSVSRSVACALLGACVLLAHWALLGEVAHPGSTVASPPPTARPTRVALSLSRTQPDAPQQQAAAPAAQRHATAPAAQRHAAAPAAPRAPSRPATPPQPAAPAADAAMPQPPIADATAAAAGEPIPVYATQLPGPARLSFRLQRGDRTGSGSLQWRVDDAGYRLTLHTEWPGQPVQGSASHGMVDADGVAPVRHAELRREREVRAVNFQREARLISFSGPQAMYPLRAGAQDRLSWMIQLPAILEADARLARPGAQVTLFVAGTRGDAEAWHFEVLGRETLQLPAGDVPDALQLKREPSRPYDTRIEVWLDPARRHLPVRARFTTLPGGTPLELTLLAADDPAHLEKATDGPR